MELISTEIFALLIVVAVFAGMIDAIAGGGGLIALPALLWAGVPPIQALATNKLQGSFGTATATINFVRRGEIDLLAMRGAVVWTFIGSVLGTLSVQYINNDWLSDLIPILLISFAVYFMFSPKIGDEDAKQRISYASFGLIIGLSVGFYDGFFGPGTGSFFAAAYVMLLGFNLRRATANTKLLNFTSNIASLIFFAAGGQVVWVLGLGMGLGQIIGAWIGSNLVIKHGSSLIKPVLVTVSIAVSIKLIFSD